MTQKKEATHDYFVYDFDKGRMNKCKQTGCSWDPVL